MTPPPTHLSLAVHGGSTGGQNLYAYFLDSNGNALLPAKNIATYITGGVPANAWAVATIPLADMQAATTTIKGLAIESDAATTVYYDTIKLVGASGGGGGSATTYAYDHADSRVKLTDGSTTTSFPNKLYEQQGTTGTSTKHIFHASRTLCAHGSSHRKQCGDRHIRKPC